MSDPAAEQPAPAPPRPDGGWYLLGPQEVRVQGLLRLVGVNFARSPEEVVSLLQFGAERFELRGTKRFWTGERATGGRGGREDGPLHTSASV